MNSLRGGLPRLWRLRVIGTVGILMAGKERGFLAKIRPELDRLLAVRFFMDQDLYDRVIAQAGE